MTGILAALDEEVDALIADLTDVRTETFGRLAVYSGRLYGYESAVCRSGVGKVAAAYAATVLAVKYGVGAIINTGVAGGTVPRGSMVISDRLVQHDVRSDADGLPAGQIDGYDSPFIPADETLVTELCAAAARCGIEPVRGVIASGDQFICDGAAVARLKEMFGISAVDMESAAVAQICALSGVRFAAVRTITDNANESAAGDFYELLHLAASRSAAVLKAYFRSGPLA